MGDVFADLSDGAIYEPSSPEEVAIILHMLNIQTGEPCVDLGSGDGRIVIGMAQEGAFAYGIEKDTRLVHESRERIAQLQLFQQAYIIHANFWAIRLSPFQKVVVYQYITVMERLEEKLQDELQPGSVVVSHHWRFSEWNPLQQIRDIYLYRKE